MPPLLLLDLDQAPREDLQPRRRLAEFLLDPAPLADVNECDHGPDHLPAAADRVGPVFDREACPIAAPEHFVFGVGLLPAAAGAENPASLAGEGSPVGPRVVNEPVQLPAQQVGLIGVSQEPGGRRR